MQARFGEILVREGHKNRYPRQKFTDLLLKLQ